MGNDKPSHRPRPPPAPGSLRAILLKNCTTRLFIHPFEWTADHLRAFGVELVTSASLWEPVAEDIESQVVGSKTIKKAIKDINSSKLLWRDKATRKLVIDIAEVQNLQLGWERLHFMYENQDIVKLHDVLIARAQSTSEIDSRLPIWAYTDHKSTSATRRKWYDSRKKPWSFVLKEIKRKAELPIDPVYIAILIALAQQRRRFIPQGPTSHRVTLFAPIHESIVISSAHPRSTPSLTSVLAGRQEIISKIVQYTADISTTYLQKFEDPYKFHDASLRIERKILPINEVSMFFQSIQSAFNDLDTYPKFLSEGSMSKRKALEELHPNTNDQKLESKRRKVCSV
ncbi:bac21deb-73f2-4658-9c8d-4b5b0e101ead [Sclerotinia trifoliorum]|uniref:Bac21deb-73f2-4658-9c8d-4b5b0e101ead n=1 Tax=Sclerotinia trifoliorum TaxID=28548 RepID=A0A8H2VQB8_9HELO|nr:bac21deb-73f2-4658-9c8d-4b5b0e101ead [Sclerotinia trifoliorum]